jgi:hypothetical protein
MSDHRTTAIRDAASRRTAEAEARVRDALKTSAQSGARVSFVAIATAAGVSRQFLYTRPELRGEIERLRAQAVSRLPARGSADSDSTRARLRAALEDNQRLRDENRLLKEELAVAHGELRELRQHRPQPNGTGSNS